MKKIYLDRVLHLIQNKSARAQINAELESHILDKADYYTEIGYSREIALQRATEEMGSPDDAAVPLNSLHKRGADKNIWSIITAVFAAALTLLCFGAVPGVRMFHYSEQYMTHSVLTELISLFICFAFVLLIYMAYRQKNSFSALLIVIALALTIAPDMLSYAPKLDFRLFQPMVYPLVMILTHGNSEYCDSIFGYCYISDTEGLLCRVGSALVFLILLTCSVVLLIAILRQQKMKTTRRMWESVRIAISVICIVTAVNLIAVILATAFALSNIESKRAEMLSARRSAIDFVVNTDLSEGTEKVTEKLLANGYEYSLVSFKYQTLHRGYNGSVISVFNMMDDYSIHFYDMSKDNPLFREVRDIFLSKDELSHIKKDMTLDEFLSMEYYYKADSVEKEYNSDKNLQTCKFSFSLNSNSHGNYSCIFVYAPDKNEFLLSEFGTI